MLIGSLIVIGWTLYPKSTTKWWLLGIGLILILLMMMSRIIVNVHYPSDTLGGFMLGSCLLYLSTRLTTGYRTGPLKPQHQ